jgi:hypothetical protein
MSRSGIAVDPDPPREGGSVTLSFPHSGPWFISVDPGGEVVEVTPDANNEVEMTTPGQAGGSFSVTDFRDPPTSARFTVGPSST